MEKARRSQAQRRSETRKALLDAAREQFLRHGYGEASTVAVVQAAGLTRGALYHHFADKHALFRAVIEQEAADVAAAIDEESSPAQGPRAEFWQGVDRYLAAMAAPGRVPLLLLEGPAVLGPQVMREIDGRSGARTIQDGLVAMGIGEGDAQLQAIMADMLSALFERAALYLSQDTPHDRIRQALGGVLAGFLPREEPKGTEPAGQSRPTSSR